MSDTVLGLLIGVGVFVLLTLPCWIKLRSLDNDKIPFHDARQAKNDAIDVESGSNDPEKEMMTADSVISSDTDLLVVREVLTRRQESEIVKLEQMQSDVASGKTGAGSLDASFESIESYSAILNDLEELQNIRRSKSSVGQIQDRYPDRFSLEWVRSRANELGIDLNESGNNIDGDVKLEKCYQEENIKINDTGRGSYVNGHSQRSETFYYTDGNKKNEVQFKGNRLSRFIRSCFDEIIYYSSLMPPRSQDRYLSDMLVTCMISPLIQGFCELLIICIVSHRLGSDAVIAFGLTTAILELNNKIIQGLPKAANIHSKRAISVMQPSTAAHYIQLSIITSLLYVTLTYASWYVIIDDFLVLIGVPRDVAKMAQSLVQILFVSGVINSISSSTKSLIEADGYSSFISSLKTVACLWKTISIFLALVLFDEKLNAVGWSCVVVDATILLFLILNSYWTGSYFWSTYYEGIFKSFSLNKSAVVITLYNAWRPLLIGDLLDVKVTSLFVLFTPSIGYYETAAWVILIYIFEFILLLAKAIGETVASRVDALLGIGNYKKARIVGDVGIVYGSILSFCLLISGFLLRNLVDNMVSSDRRVQPLISQYVPIIGEIFIATMISCVCKSILYAQQQINFANFVVRGCTWFISIPLSIGAVFKFDFGLNGVMGALAASSFISGFILWDSIIQADLEQISDQVRIRNEKMGRTFDSGIDGTSIAAEKNMQGVVGSCEQSAASDVLDSDSIDSDSTPFFSNIGRMIEVQFNSKAQTDKNSRLKTRIGPRPNLIDSHQVCLPIIYEQHGNVNEPFYPVITETDLINERSVCHPDGIIYDEDQHHNVVIEDKALTEKRFEENKRNKTMQDESGHDASSITTREIENETQKYQTQYEEKKNSEPNITSTKTENEVTENEATEYIKSTQNQIALHEQDTTNEISTSEVQTSISAKENPPLQLEPTNLRSWWTPKTSKKFTNTDNMSLSCSTINILRKDTDQSISLSEMRANLSQMQLCGDDKVSLNKHESISGESKKSDLYLSEDVPEDECLQDEYFSSRTEEYNKPIESVRNIDHNESLVQNKTPVTEKSYIVQNSLSSAPDGAWLDIHSKKRLNLNQSLDDHSLSSRQWILQSSEGESNMIQKNKIDLVPLEGEETCFANKHPNRTLKSFQVHQESEQNHTPQSIDWFDMKTNASFSICSEPTSNQSFKYRDQLNFNDQSFDGNTVKQPPILGSDWESDQLEDKSSVANGQWLPQIERTIAKNVDNKGLFEQSQEIDDEASFKSNWLVINKNKRKKSVRVDSLNKCEGSNDNTLPPIQSHSSSPMPMWKAKDRTVVNDSGTPSIYKNELSLSDLSHSSKLSTAFPEVSQRLKLGTATTELLNIDNADNRTSSQQEYIDQEISKDSLPRSNLGQSSIFVNNVASLDDNECGDNDSKIEDLPLQGNSQRNDYLSYDSARSESLLENPHLAPQKLNKPYDNSELFNDISGPGESIIDERKRNYEMGLEPSATELAEAKRYVDRVSDSNWLPTVPKVSHGQLSNAMPTDWLEFTNESDSIIPSPMNHNDQLTFDQSSPSTLNHVHHKNDCEDDNQSSCNDDKIAKSNLENNNMNNDTSQQTATSEFNTDSVKNIEDDSNNENRSRCNDEENPKSTLQRNVKSGDTDSSSDIAKEDEPFVKLPKLEPIVDEDANALGESSSIVESPTMHVDDVDLNSNLQKDKQCDSTRPGGSSEGKSSRDEESFPDLPNSAAASHNDEIVADQSSSSVVTLTAYNDNINPAVTT